MLRFDCHRETKVDNFDFLGVVVVEYIVKLQITMHNALRVHVADRKKQLSKDNSASLFVHSLIWQLLYMMIDAHARTQLHHEVNMSSLVYNFIQTHDVRVP